MDESKKAVSPAFDQFTAVLQDQNVISSPERTDESYVK